MNSDEKFVKFLSGEKETELLINTYRGEGYEKGTLQEKQKIAKEILSKDMDINLISELTKLSKEKNRRIEIAISFCENSQKVLRFFSKIRLEGR